MLYGSEFCVFSSPISVALGVSHVMRSINVRYFFGIGERAMMVTSQKAMAA